MRRAAVESWRFAEDLGQITHAVLYVRDALGLPVEPAPGTPPRLAGEVPDRSDILEGTARDHAGPHWARWWRSLIAQEARMHLGPDGDRGQWMRSVHSELLQVIDPPEWASLAGQPELRSAAQALFTDGCGVNFQVSVADIEPLLASLRQAAHPLLMEPEARWYTVGDEDAGVTQFLVADPDGYLVRFQASIGRRPVIR
jgi:hypothetical protein